jgi:hypothetical protein
MCINITYHQKIHYKTPPITLVLKYICNFHTLWHVFFWHKYISYVQVCKFLLGFILRYTNLSLKLMQYTWNEQKLSRMWRPRVPKKNQMHISISMTTIFGGRNVLSPKVEIKNMDIKKQRMNFMFPRKWNYIIKHHLMDE